MIVEVAAILVAIAFAVLVGYLVPLLIQSAQDGRGSRDVGEQAQCRPPDAGDGTAGDESKSKRPDGTGAWQGRACRRVAARGGRVGESVNQVHGLMRGSGGTLLANVASVVAGLRAAKHVVTERFKEGGHHNGG